MNQIISLLWHVIRWVFCCFVMTFFVFALLISWLIGYDDKVYDISEKFLQWVWYDIKEK